MKSGFTAILGRPNVGKSTLLNALVGAKLAIVSPKPQTTREAIQGVVTREQGQIVFVDSPGFHRPKLQLGKRMMREIERAVSGAHLVVLVVDAGTAPKTGDRAVIEMVRRIGGPTILALNKIDRVKNKDELLPRIEAYRLLHEFVEYVPLSALRGDNVDLLERLIFERLPEAPPYYPEDYITDQPERFLAAELIRERILHETREEVPHSTAVIIEQWKESPRLLRLLATIYVERKGQKLIVVGKGGEMLKQIGTRARESLEAQFGRKVFLELFVKVTPKWRDRPSFMKDLDYYRFGTEAGAPEEPAARG